MFSEFELQLLDISHETFADETHIFDVAGRKKFSDIVGIEYFIQTKLVVALEDRGLSVTLEGKKKRDCDIIVEDRVIGALVKYFKNMIYQTQILLSQH